MDTLETPRRSVLGGLGLIALAALQTGGSAQAAAPASGAGASDFDFLMGRWRVRHHRLKRRLAGDDHWEDFDGTSVARKILGGAGNMDENVIDLPAGRYEGATFRLFDHAAQTWSIWWIDSRSTRLDPPVVGRFDNGRGVFLCDDTFEGRPIRVRYIWSDITARTCHWEQAFSPDGEKSWETNWRMQFHRT